jgi:hydrogenase maturation protein HypF
LRKAAKQLTLSGQVQGVGFRPFIYRIAVEHDLVGWVRNCVGIVEIRVQGRPQDLEKFIEDIFDRKPPLAKPKIESEKPVDVEAFDAFSILESQFNGIAQISVPTDLFLCDDCLAELNDPANRRYHYPFINCTQCGPRYTLIKSLPYDRANTTMAGFEMCAACQAEYDDPADRRYHAEPIACPDCGPSLSFHGAGISLNDNEAAIAAAVEVLRQGGVVAVKGIGGYHLMCDASSSAAVTQLRNRKSRPHKPLAVMFSAPPDEPFKYIEASLFVDEKEKLYLSGPARPILLLTKRADSQLSEQIAPGLNEVGVMLPYSPLHHLLLAAFDGPLVATSANISGEPVLTKNHQVEQRLEHVTDAFLHHDRPIERPADDPVYRTIAGKVRPIRTGRGSAPSELSLPFELETPVLAVGAHMKNTITLAWGDRAVVSPHIGEMDTLRSREVFERTVSDLQSLYGVVAEHIVCDAHPGYTTTRWARKQALAVHPVLHHHAHASAAYYEYTLQSKSDGPVIAFTWDGVGFGGDGSLWGGETFLGKPGEWVRVATIRPFHLPGGEKAGREPWRSAAAVSWEIEQDTVDIPVEYAAQLPMLKQAWQRRINAPATTSMGRLFDAAAALTGICSIASYEGQGPMVLEALSKRPSETPGINIEYSLTIENNILIYNWKTLVIACSDSTLSVAERATLFHYSLAQLILQKAILLREKHAVNIVTLSGGVFQNRVLTEQAIRLLSANDFEVCLPELIPVNDAGISFGQVMEYGYSMAND